MVAEVGEGEEVHGCTWGNGIGICVEGIGVSCCSIGDVVSMSANAHDSRCGRGILTGLGEAGSCEQLRGRGDRMILLRFLARLLTETTPIPDRSGGRTDA
jgi:hypothetical protein